MSVVLTRMRSSVGRVFNLAVCVAGVLVLVGAARTATSDAHTVPFAICVAGVLLTVMVARFPILLDRGDGGAIEVGFDSLILIFMLCTLQTADALVVWSLAVVATQLTSDKRPFVKVFNSGLGIVAGGLAGLVHASLRDPDLTSGRELVAVGLAAAAYFSTDLVLTTLSMALTRRHGVRRRLVRRDALLAVACFVPFDTLGYLGAVVHRTTPWWTLSLLCVPLATLLVATRAVTRGRENARRLTVLFDAAVRAQTHPDRPSVERALVEDARRLLRITAVSARGFPPGRGEIGAEVLAGEDPLWVVAKALDRARSTSQADAEALQALAAVAAEALSRLRLTDEMVHVARHDPLTDLPNRGILRERVDDALSRPYDDALPAALLFLDLDDFKPINDRFGHAAGDAVLLTVADRIRIAAGSLATVARLGGDEFAVLFEHDDPSQVRAAGDRVLRAIGEPLVVAGQRPSVTASVGIAFAATGDDATGLLRKADLAMYAAKGAGKGQVAEYDDQLGRSRIERLELADDLRRAVLGGRIEVAYQPIIAVDTGLIVGAEALARWQRGGVAVPPDVFVPVAEEAGLIGALGAQVLARAAADVAALEVDGPFMLTVNVSVRQLLEPRFLDRVHAAVERVGDVSLVLELTEREGIDLSPEVLGMMDALNACGARLAVDDFGIGFSSISYLHDLPVQLLKTDASLAHAIDTDERAHALLRSVIGMGRTLGLDLIVEGIERESQLAALADDVDGLRAQGYLMYRPMSADQLAAIVAADRTVSTIHSGRARRWQRVRDAGAAGAGGAAGQRAAT